MKLKRAHLHLRSIQKYLLIVSCIPILAMMFQSTASQAQDTTSVKIPSAVRGVMIAKVDSLYRTFTIQWKPSPVGEHVDSYAIYSKDGTRPNISKGLLVTVTKKNFVTLKSWVPTYSSQPPHTVKIVLNADSEFWVIAHNEYGWGENAFESPYPSEAKAMTLTEIQKANDFPHIVYHVWICNAAIKSHYGNSQCA